jgi:hypothetical protein
LAVAALVLWTLFVWGGRIRNVLSDADAEGAQRWGTLALSVSFVALALVTAVLFVRRVRSAGAENGGVRHGAAGHRGAVAASRVALQALAGWTTVVWILRAGDIALAGDHAVGFVVVHVALAAVSIALAAWAVLADRSAVASPTGSVRHVG